MATNIIISGEGTDGYVELAAAGRQNVKGRLFKKQILHFDSFKNPNDPSRDITIDENFAKSLVTNFSKGVCDIVQVPIVNEKNQHVEDPTRNIGRVVDIDYDDKGVFVYIDALKHGEDLGKTLIGASAMMNLDYTDTRTGERVGPTLLHCAVTNRPYINNLDGFSEIISASRADTQEETVLLGASEEPIEEKIPMNLEELMAELKDKHGIDVAALQAQITAKEAEVTKLSSDLSAKDEEVVQLSATLAEKDEETSKLSTAIGEGEEIKLSEVAEAVVQLAAEKKDLETKFEQQVVALSALQGERDKANHKIAENEIDGYIKAGRILPKQREAMIRLSLEDRKTFDSLLPEDSIVALTEGGVTTHEVTNDEQNNNNDGEDKQAEAVKRYLEMADAQSGRKNTK